MMTWTNNLRRKLFQLSSVLTLKLSSLSFCYFCKIVATGIIVLFLTFWRLIAVFCIIDALDGAVFTDAKCKKRKVRANTTGPLCIVQSEALLLCCHACAWLSMCRQPNWTPESARLQTSLTKVNVGTHRLISTVTLFNRKARVPTVVRVVFSS